MGKEEWMNSTLVSTVNEPVVKPKVLEEGAVSICSFTVCLLFTAPELLHADSTATLIFVVVG